MPKTRFLGGGLRKYISLYYYNDYRIHYVYFFYFFRDRPRFTRGFRKHLFKSIPHQSSPRALSKIQTCFKGLRQLKSVPPCTLLSTSFCRSKNSLLRRTSGVHAATETGLRKKHHCSAFFRTNDWNQGGFLGQRPKSPFFFWGL